jgi:hypothetical protein
LFERTHPTAQHKIKSAAHKQMDVFRHNDVSTNGNVEIVLRPLGKGNERRVDIIVSQTSPSVMRAKRDEVDRVWIENSR